MDAFPDILYKLFCLSMTVLYVLVKFLLNNHNIICFSARNYLDHQLLSHGRTSNRLIHVFHHKICTLCLPQFLSVELSSTFSPALVQQFFSCLAFTWVDFSRCLVYSCSVSLEHNGSFVRTLPSSTIVMRSSRSGSCNCFFLIA